MQNKEGRRVVILFHKILILVDFAKLEFIKEHIMNRFILNQRRKDKVAWKTFKNELFVQLILRFSFNCEVLIDLLILRALLNWTELFSFSTILILDGNVRLHQPGCASSQSRVGDP